VIEPALEIRFTDTPLRTVSEVVSLIAIAVLVAMGWLDYRLRDSWAQMAVAPVQPVCPVTWPGLAALGITLFVLKFSVVDRYDTLLCWRRLQNGQLKSALYASDVVIAGRTRLLGYDIDWV